MLKHEIQVISEITQPNATRNRFRSHKAWNIKFSFLMQYDDVMTNPRWRTNAILKIVFGYISAPYWPIDAKLGSEMKNQMRRAAIFAYLICELSNFDHIWYTDADFHSEDGLLTPNGNFTKSRWRTDAILKIVFCQISAPYRPINVKFRTQMKNYMQI